MQLKPKPWKVELLCWGLKTSIQDKGRKGGAGPVGGRYVEVGGDVVNARMRALKYTPLHLRRVADEYEIVRSKPGGEKEILKASVLPRTDFYSKTTSSGALMKKVALLHGKDCLATTLYQSCSLKERCKFCAVDLSFKTRDALLWKRPHDLLEVAKSCPQAKHWTITSGYHPRLEGKMIEVLKVLKEGDDKPIHVQVSPNEDQEKLYEAGADTIGIHIEALDEKVMHDYCPGKFAMGYDNFIKALETAAGIFGEGQVSTFVILGLGESRERTMGGMEKLVREGVVPFITPFRPLERSTELEAPDPSYMLEYYESLSKMFHRYGLDPRKNRAGCVRCGACWGL